jgi:PAS domain S-box-containing protein
LDWKLDLTDASDEDPRRSMWYLSQAQRLAHVGYWDRDLDAGCITLSDESCHIFGLPPQRHVELTQWHERWLQLIHAEDRPKIAEAAAVALRGGPPYDVEYRVLRPSGDMRIVRSRAEVTWDESGRPRRMFGVMQDVTDLRRAEERLRAMAESSLVGIYVVQETAFRYVNPAMARMFGYAVEEVVDRLAPAQLVHPDDLPGVVTHFRRPAEGESDEVRHEFRGLRKDGSAFPVEVHGRRIDVDGQPGVMGVLLDNTERKRAERELRRSQVYLAEAQRLSRTGSFGWDPSRAAITWSDETYRIFGLDPATPPTIALVLERTHPDDRFALESAIRRAEQEGTGFDLEHRLLLPGGTVKHLHVVARAVSDEADRREFVGAVMDITEQRRAEEERRAHVEELRASESRFRILFDFAADAFMIHDETGAVVDANRQACENLGYAREELIGKPLAHFDADFDAAMFQRVKEQVEAGEIVTFETRQRRKDGTVFPVEIRARLVRQIDRLLAVSLSRDITERKRAEEERERLRQAEADLARISRATTMGEFTASLAHEIRQPVAAAITNAKACIRWLARGRPDLAEARAAAERIVADATRVADIVTRVRALYKNDAPRQERVDVNGLVRETLALLRSEASRHAVSMRAELAPDLPPAVGDRVQLQQVLVNLILNGLEATGAAPGVLRVESARGGAGELLVTVSDEGVGLPDGVADRIFDAFFTTKPQGTGMGLAISRSIVERHGGRLWATPAKPRGTSFHVSLPADPAE